MPARCLIWPAAVTIGMVSCPKLKPFGVSINAFSFHFFCLSGERCNQLVLPDGGFKEGDSELVVYNNVTVKPKSLLPPFIEIFSSEN